MVENDRNRTYGIVAGVMFIVFALAGLFDFIRWMHFNDLFFSVANSFIAAGILMKNKEKQIVIGFVGLSAVELITFFENFYYNNYDIWDYYYTHFNFFCMLPNLLKTLSVFGMMIVVLAVFTDKLDKHKEEIKRIWYVPLIVRGMAFVVSVLVMLGSNGNWVYSYGWISFTNFMMESLAIVSFVMMFMWSGADFVKSDFRYETADAQYQRREGDQYTASYSGGWIEAGYIGMVKHVLLLVLTFGIWNLIWIYRLTDYLNNVEGTTRRGPWAQLLLCIFVPFYLIYWIYDSSKRIDILAQQNGVNSDITIVSTLFAIFFYFFAPVFMQDKINDIVRVRSDRATFNQQSASSSNADYYRYKETSTSNEGMSEEQPACDSYDEDSASEPSYQGYTYNMRNDDDSFEEFEPFEPNTGYTYSPLNTVDEEEPMIYVHPESVLEDDGDLEEKGKETAPETPVKESESEGTKPTMSASEIAAELKIYKELLDKNIITQEEFNLKKKELLGL